MITYMYNGKLKYTFPKGKAESRQRNARSSGISVRKREICIHLHNGIISRKRSARSFPTTLREAAISIPFVGTKSQTIMSSSSGDQEGCYNEMKMISPTCQSSKNMFPFHLSHIITSQPQLFPSISSLHFLFPISLLINFIIPIELEKY